jgi:hypothetical protein
MLKSDFRFSNIMTIDDKVRYGMMALGGASLVFAAMGLHIGPLETLAGSGTM